MKPVLRALVWLGLCGGIGFFAGWQFGEKRAKKEALDTLNEKTDEIRDHVMEHANKNIAELKDRYEKEKSEMRAQYEAAVDAVRSYKGYDTDGDSVTTFANHVEVPEWATQQSTVIVPEDVPEMPMDEPEMPADVLDEDEDEEEEIPQLHPQDILPHAISKGEFLQNEGNYDVVDLDYYTDDDVIFDPKAEEKWTHPEQLLGIAWSLRFISAPGKPRISEIFIQNDTMETLYRITRIDDSFAELYEEE